MISRRGDFAKQALESGGAVKNAIGDLGYGAHPWTSRSVSENDVFQHAARARCGKIDGFPAAAYHRSPCIWLGVGWTDNGKTVGFEPSAILFAGVENATAWGYYGRGGHGFGIALSPTNRHSDAHRWRADEAGNNSGTSGLETNYALVFADDATTGPELAIDLQSTSSTGFTLRKYIDNTADATLIYLALEGMAIDRDVLTEPTTTGNQSVTDPGFRPSA